MGSGAVEHGAAQAAEEGAAEAGAEAEQDGVRSVEVAEDGTTLSTATECVGWRQTTGCDPAGERDAAGDLGCADRVKNGLSGYCECADGRRSMVVTCAHSPFTCGNACAGRVSDGTTQSGSSFDRFVRECDSGDGLLVSPRKGDALLFYSQTPTARLDPESYHGGCPVIQGTKWAANVWIWNRKRPVFDGATKAQVDSTEMSMVFLNTRQHYIEVYWIDFSGNNKYFDRIAPQQTYSVNTHLGHKWVIKHGDKELKRVVASRGMGGAVSI